MLLPDYLSRNLTPPIPTKDGGTLRTIGEACEYMAAIGKEREQRRHWQQIRELMLQEADVAAVSRRVRLAVLKDAKVDVTALSESMERWMDEPPWAPAWAARFQRSDGVSGERIPLWGKFAGRSQLPGSR